MRSHHEVWLKAHGERSAEWLREMLVRGFDVHHLDGDHDNNDPKNLVLIECGDHMMLHNGATRFSRVVGKNRGGGRPKKPKAAPVCPVNSVSSHEMELRKSVDEISAEHGIDWSVFERR